MQYLQLQLCLYCILYYVENIFKFLQFSKGNLSFDLYVLSPNQRQAKQVYVKFLTVVLSIMRRVKNVKNLLFYGPP